MTTDPAPAVRSDAAPPPQGQSMALEYLIRVSGAVLVTAGALLLAVVEAFLVPFKLGGAYIPVAAALAVGGNIVLPLWILWLARARYTALLPGLVWFVVVVVLASPTSSGDLIIPGTWPGMAMLLSGAATIAVMGYLAITGAVGKSKS